MTGSTPAGAPVGPRRANSVPLAAFPEVAKRTLQRYRTENMTDRAAALTYYGLLALFPTLLALVALLGLLGRHPGTTNALLDIVGNVGSEQMVEAVREPLQSVVQNRGGAGALFGIGLLGALWSASGYIGAFSRAGNAVWEVDEGRPFWRWKPLQVVIALGMIVMLALVGIGVVVSGALASAVGDALGLSDAAVLTWRIVKWPAIALLAVGIVTILFWATPNVRQPKLRWLTPGAAFTVVVWVVASALFAFYVSRFGSYNATYGSVGGIIILMIWLWITNNALLLGATLDAEIERERQIRALEPGARDEIQLPEREPSG